MTDLQLAIRPIDTWMFRDGRPFSQDDPGAAQAVSVCPPYPPTVVGLVRAELARQYGWDGTHGGKPWPANKLGDGVDWQSTATTLGSLRFTAPAVCVSTVAALALNTQLYPAPRSLLANKAWLHGLTQAWPKTPFSEPDAFNGLTHLRPLKVQAFKSDLGGAATLVEPVGDVDDGLVTLDNWWLTSAGITAFLSGGLPGSDQLVPQAALWASEPRVGIGIDGERGSQLAERRVIDGALYMASHVRLAPGVELRVGVNLPADVKWDQGRHLAPAGGEHRVAELQQVHDNDRPKIDAVNSSSSASGTVRVLVYHTGPCILDPMPEPGGTLPGLPGKIVSACLGRPQRIGGWDTINRRPIAMRSAIPPGSIWFLDIDAANAPPNGKLVDRIGKHTEWGFGEILVGTWDYATAGAAP